MKSLYKEIGSKIKELRESHGMSQRELAEMLRFETDTAVSLIESGQRRIHIDKLVIIATHFRVSLYDLIECLPQPYLNQREEKLVLDFIDHIKRKNPNDGENSTRGGL